MQYRSPLARARGLGSAKTGTAHWWLQRVTAAALIPLTLWLLLLMEFSFHAPYQQTVQWLSSPWNSVCIIAWIIAAFYHAAIGLQVVIEDYVSSEGLKIISVWMVKLLFLFLGLAAVTAIFRIILVG